MYSLSRDHKPTDSGEQKRIFKEGGKIYRTEMVKIRKDRQCLSMANVGSTNNTANTTNTANTANTNTTNNTTNTNNTGNKKSK